MTEDPISTMNAMRALGVTIEAEAFSLNYSWQGSQWMEGIIEDF